MKGALMSVSDKLLLRKRHYFWLLMDLSRILVAICLVVSGRSASMIHW